MDVKPETFITRFVMALGYYAETTYFFAERTDPGGTGELQACFGLHSTGWYFHLGFV